MTGQVAFREAIFLADCAHAKFVLDVMGEGFSSALLLALSADAYGAALRFGARHVLPPYDVSDYRQSLEDDCALNLRLSREWLHEMDLAVFIEGVNLAELDGLNQFLFFQQAMHIARTTRAMLEILPAGIVPRVPVGATPLAADLYLDSDIAAAIVRHVGDAMGRPVEPLIMADRPLRFAACTDRRPFLDSSVRATGFRRAEAAPADRRRVGFVPAVVSGIGEYYAALNALAGDEVTVFASPWADRPSGAAIDGILPGEDWLASARGLLEQTRQAFWYRIERSSLPDYLRDNPYLRFQFDYIFSVRWLAYASYIYSAAHFVRENPLDLLIYCDHFVGEGAILADLYRRSGTRTAIATHSLHTCDVPFVAWNPADSAIVRSAFAARQALNAGLAAAYTVPAAVALPPGPDQEADRPRRILFLGNAVEAPEPLIDMRAYLGVIRTLAKTPPPLEGRVELMMRLKPGVFSEYWENHCLLCGSDPQSFMRGAGLSMEESIAWADCVIGAGIPTSGYLEVLARGKPLIHVATGACFPTSANLFPTEIADCVIEPERLWAELEALLFDEIYRAGRLAIQDAFFAADQTASFPGAPNQIAAAIEAILA